MGSVALRQGDANSPALKLDGIRISTNWEDIVGTASSPTLLVNPATLNGFSYLQGAGPSASQSYQLSGINLTGFPDNIAVAAPTDYEVSLDNSIFGTSVSVPYTSATLDATTIYVRLKSGLSLGTYLNENVVNSGGGASSVNVTCNGAVVEPEPTNHATNFAAGTTTALTIPLTWTDATGGTVPTGYLVKASATSYEAITAPVDLVPESDGTYVKNVAAGVQTVTFTGLLPGTTYYFKIWPYTNTGTFINYKTDGSVPQQSAATLDLYFRSLTSGAWNAAATWEISNDGNTWIPATTETPLYRTSDVTIRNGHAVTVPNNTGTSRDLTVENGATLWVGAGTSFFVYVYGDILNDGTIGGATDGIGFDIEGTSCTISGTGSFIASRMSKYTTANATTNLTIGQNLSLTYTHATNAALYNNPSGTTTFNIILMAGRQLSVPNANISLTGCTFTLNSDATGTASLLAKSTSGGSTTVQRYISAWTDAAHGWHLLSAPVASQAISPDFTDPTPANYDFYKWDEVNNIWLNQKDGLNGITTFDAGIGYLVAYQSAGARQFSGVLNTANVTVSGLTNTGGAHAGWNLAGNPYSCAIANDLTAWTTTGTIASTAKVWDEASAAYVDVATSGIIPAMNGFMVHVETAPASFTIPTTARQHSAQAWYKNTGDQIILIAYDRSGNTAQRLVVGANENATEGYDNACDSRFLAGYAPVFYATAGDDYLSTTILPALNTETSITLGFVKNAFSEFSIGLAPESAAPGMPVYLKDNFTGMVTELKGNVEYTFTSLQGDDANRFQLSFGATGIDDPETSTVFRAYANHGNIYIYSSQADNAQVRISNLLGQPVLTGSANGHSLTTLNAASLPRGVYIVSLISGTKVSSQKVTLSR